MNVRSSSIAAPASSPWTMSPASLGVLDEVVHERVDALRAGVAEHGDRLGGQLRLAQHAGAHRVVDVVVDVGDAVDEPHDRALERAAACGARPEWQRMPSRTSSRQVQPAPSARARRRRAASARSGGSRGRSARCRHSSSTASPMWPNGGWPRSWPRPIASARSSLSRSARATVRDDLRDLQRVGQPRAVVVALGRDEDLRLVLQAAERLGVHDPVAVALQRRAQPAVGLRRCARRAG